MHILYVSQTELSHTVQYAIALFKQWFVKSKTLRGFPSKIQQCRNNVNQSNNLSYITNRCFISDTLWYNIKMVELDWITMAALQKNAGRFDRNGLQENDYEWILVRNRSWWSWNMSLQFWLCPLAQFKWNTVYRSLSSLSALLKGLSSICQAHRFTVLVKKNKLVKVSLANQQKKKNIWSLDKQGHTAVISIWGVCGMKTLQSSNVDSLFSCLWVHMRIGECVYILYSTSPSVSSLRRSSLSEGTIIIAKVQQTRSGKSWAHRVCGLLQA